MAKETNVISLTFDSFPVEDGDVAEIVVAFTRAPLWWERLLIRLKLMSPLKPDELRVRVNRVCWWHTKANNRINVTDVHIVEYRW